MYVIEITEDKVDSMMEHIGKSIKCLNHVAECLEEMKSGGHHEEDDDYEYDQFRDGGRRMYRGGGREMYRGGGRYNRY